MNQKQLEKTPVGMQLSIHLYIPPNEWVIAEDVSFEASESELETTFEFLKREVIRRLEKLRESKTT